MTVNVQHGGIRSPRSLVNIHEIKNMQKDMSEKSERNTKQKTQFNEDSTNVNIRQELVILGRQSWHMPPLRMVEMQNKRIPSIGRAEEPATETGRTETQVVLVRKACTDPKVWRSIFQPTTCYWFGAGTLNSPRRQGELAVASQPPQLSSGAGSQDLELPALPLSVFTITLGFQL